MNPSTRRGRDTKSLPLMEQLFVTDTCCGSESQFLQWSDPGMCFLFCYFFVLLVFFFLREKEHDIGWVGR